MDTAALHDRTSNDAGRRAAYEWMAVGCACLAALLYANTLRHGFALDDYPTIYGNRLTTAGLRGIPTLLHTGYWYGLDGMNDWLYRPLSMVMFAVEWQIAPNTPALGHWINVVIYALTAFVLFRFLLELFDGFSLVVPFAISVLWIAHPLHTEVVANIKSRDELLAFLFSLLTMWQCLAYVRAPRLKPLLLAGLCFFLALMSKESPITLLVIVPMMLFVFTRSDAKTIARVMAPIAMAAIVYLAIRSSVLTSQTGDSPISLIDNSLIAAPDMLHRLATAFWIGGRYVRLLFFPHPMSSDYSYRQIPVVGFDNLYASASLLLYAALTVVGAVRLLKRDPIGYGILFYLISIALVSNVLFLTRSTMADRFLYAPSLGFCIVLVLLLGRVFRLHLSSQVDARSLAGVWRSNRAFAGAVGLLVVASAALTVARNRDWKNDTTLFSADSRHSPNSARVHFLHANHLLQELKKGRVAPSRQREQYVIVLREFRRAIELYPAYAEPHMGIGEAYTYANDVPAATAWYSQMVARNPRFAAGYMALGNVFVSAGDYISAIASFRNALAIDPNDATANFVLGSAYRTMGDSVRAELYLSRAIVLDPRLKR